MICMARLSVGEAASANLEWRNAWKILCVIEAHCRKSIQACFHLLGFAGHSCASKQKHHAANSCPLKRKIWEEVE